MTSKQNALLQIVVIYIITAFVGFVSWQYFKVSYSEIMAFLLADIAMTIVIFIASLIKRNSSVYDAYWSVLPFYFVALWIYIYGNNLSVINWLTFVVISFWSWRLTLNWARSWPNFSHEDWRYVDLKNKTKAFYPMVNFLGIHVFPTLVVFACMLPVFYSINASTNLVWLAGFGLLVSVVGILFELFADNELDKFRQRTNPKQSDILNTGLWAKCRNPNYLGEMLFWVGLALLGISFNAHWIAYVGVVVLILMFVFVSIPMKEERMEKRRPQAWKQYKQTVNKLLPF